ncbi:MAG: hypothetical protein JW821_20715 [Deltaproteobacteria bacterium]|nr:hypothetical protein [Deltaproteobacteria bacterium]
MEKILIANGRAQDIALLRACCRVLFPECEIRILAKREGETERQGEDEGLEAAETP